ncbi:MAG: hypothetical protein AAGD33_01940 [Actinomycetota bacterium]
MAQSGCLVHLVAESSALRHRLGDEFYTALRCDPTNEPRDLRSVRIRRAALSLRRLGDGDRGPERIASRPLSIVLPSKRPDHIIDAVRQVARQRHVDIELIVGLHGARFDARHRDLVRELVPGPVAVHEFPDSVNLGEMLRELSASATAELITKWDDDDWYGDEHLHDLLLSWDYSGAQIVGKFAEFVYVEGRDATVRRSTDGAERPSRLLAGGTMLTSREWLKEVGDWPPLPRHVDQRLIDATRNCGGVTYRTHGFQYVLRRRSASTGHTWAATDEYFLSGADTHWAGLALDRADISDEPAAPVRPS